MKEETPNSVSERADANKLSLSDRQTVTFQGVKRITCTSRWLVCPGSSEKEKPVVGLASKLVRAELYEVRTEGYLWWPAHVLPQSVGVQHGAGSEPKSKLFAADLCSQDG